MNPLLLEQALLLKPAVDLVANLLKPLAQRVWGWSGKISEELYYDLFGGFETYIKNSYQRHSYFSSLVFKNEQKKLDDYYLPLTLIKHPTATKHCLTSFPLSIISNYKRLLIVDTAGMGKSTITKFLLLSCTRENAAIPILIELRKLSRAKTLLDVIMENLSGMTGHTQRDLILKLIGNGQFLFLFDGYDEVAELERPYVATGINEFITSAPNNWYVMTSREESSLASFPDFQRFTIKPLEKTEAYQLLKRYDDSDQLAKALIEKLEEAENKSVHEFLTNPLLTSLLFKSFEYKRTIPVRKHIFYRQVFEALFETHDLMKEEYQRPKRSGLDIDQFDELLRHFCFITYKDGKAEYSKDELLRCFGIVKRLIANQEVVASDVIYDLTHGVPLMIEEGNYFRWVHRSIQEYFAASWICRDSKDRQRDLLVKMFTDRSMKDQNVLALCGDIDPISFRRSVVKYLAKTLLEEFNSSYASVDKSISSEAIKQRKELVVGKLPFLANVKSKKIPIDRFARGDTPKGLDEENTLIVSSMTRYCEMKGISPVGGSWEGRGQVFGFIRRSETELLNITTFQRLFPFVKPMIRTSWLAFAQFLMPNQIFTPIDDDPGNIVNTFENFDRVNELLLTRLSWRFDEEVAIETLRLIELEEVEIDELSL